MPDPYWDGLNETVKAAHVNATAKGFWDVPNVLNPMLHTWEDPVKEYLYGLMFAQKCALIGTEIAEAENAHYRELAVSYDNPSTSEERESARREVGEEFADVAIRTYDLAGWLGVDFEALVRRAERSGARTHRGYRDAIDFMYGHLFRAVQEDRRWASVEKVASPLAWLVVTCHAPFRGSPMDLRVHVENKMAKNADRPHKHDRRY